MVDDNNSIVKSTKISLTGDIEKCGHCQGDDKRLKDNTKAGYTYEYTDVNSDAGQEQLKGWGVKEGQSVDIPIIKAETCQSNKDGTDKKCKTFDWKDSYWNDIETGVLPDEVTKVD